jgi:hypothetical protein
MGHVINIIQIVIKQSSSSFNLQSDLANNKKLKFKLKNYEAQQILQRSVNSFMVSTVQLEK